MVNYCGHCGQFHGAFVCPRIRHMEYFSNGMVKFVDYHPPADINWQAYAPNEQASRSVANIPQLT